jgi:hypothetical protein
MVGVPSPRLDSSSLVRLSPHAYTSWRYDREGINKCFASRLQHLTQDLRFVWIGNAFKANQDDTRRYLASTKDEFTEILVASEQESVCISCKVENHVVFGSPSNIVHSDNVVAAVPQCVDDYPSDVLVGNDVHR